MAETSICPCCGYDLEKDTPVSWAGFEMAPYGPVRYRGAEIKLTSAQSGVLWALLKARGQPLKRSVIADRIGCETDFRENIVDIHICRIRRALAPHGEVPIRTRRGVGVYIEGE